jgi:hypothetical protein
MPGMSNKENSMSEKRKTRQCSLCRMEGSPDEIKAPAAHIRDDISCGRFPGSDTARLAVQSYGLEYPSKVVCQGCFRTLLKVFSD